MNKEKIKAIKEIQERLSNIKDEIETLLDEEEETKENYPKNLHNGEQYERMETACFLLEEAWGEIDNAIDDLDEIY